VPVARALPAACEALAAPVPLPPVRKADLGLMAAENRAAAAQANGRLSATHACMVQERKDYGAAK
jgi:hypothetical protein